MSSRYFTLSAGSSGGAFPWPPAKRAPYTLPPYVGDRDLWFTPPNDPSFDFKRGAMLTHEIPGLPFVPGASSEYPERCLTGLYNRWAPDARKTIRKSHQDMGYNWFTTWLADMACGPVPESGQRVDAPQDLLRLHSELRDDGFLINAWMGSKNYQQWIAHNRTAEDWHSQLSPWIDPLLANDALHTIVLGGEFDAWNLGDPGNPEPFRILEWACQKAVTLKSRWNRPAIVAFHWNVHITFWGNIPGVWTLNEHRISIGDRWDWHYAMAETCAKYGVQFEMHYQGACGYPTYANNMTWTIPDLQARLADSLGSIDPRIRIINSEPGSGFAQFPKAERPNLIDACAVGYAGTVTKPKQSGGHGPFDVNMGGFLESSYKPNGDYL